MAKSSIHIEAGKIGFFSHNSRERKTENSIFKDEENFCSCDNKTAIGIYKNELEIRTAAYIKNHANRKKLHAKTITHLSAIVNLNSHHTEKDLEKIRVHLEDILDTKIIQTSIHRDEGHISESGEKIKNYHAHIEFMGLDSNGNAIRQKLDRKCLIDLQSTVADILDMERGKNYTKEKAQRPRRLGTYEYKAHAKEKSRLITINRKKTKELAKQKDLKAEIASLREELKASHAVRADYAKLEQLNKDLKSEIVSKTLTIEEMKNRIYSKKTYKDTDNKVPFEVIAEHYETKYKEEKSKNKELSVQIEELENNISILENRNASYYGLNQELQNEIREMKFKIEQLEDEVEELSMDTSALDELQEQEILFSKFGIRLSEGSDYDEYERDFEVFRKKTHIKGFPELEHEELIENFEKYKELERADLKKDEQTNLIGDEKSITNYNWKDR